MAFHAAFDSKSRLCLDMEEDIKSETSAIDISSYDLDNSNSGLGMPFTIDDWTKTPLMEELDGFAATSASSSFGDDDQPMSISLSQSQWRVQGSKITKISPPETLKRECDDLMKDVMRDDWFHSSSKPSSMSEMLPTQVLEDELLPIDDIPLSPASPPPPEAASPTPMDLTLPSKSLLLAPPSNALPKTFEIISTPIAIIPVQPCEERPKVKHSVLKAKLNSETRMPEALNCLMPSLTQVLYGDRSQPNSPQPPSKPQPPYVCRLCHKDFGSLVKLQSHQKMKHHLCRVCSNCFEHVSQLEEHQRQVHYKCTLCKEAFDSDEELRRHEMKHLRHFQRKTKKEICAECECDISGAKESHECYVMHCLLCDKPFRNLYKLTLHKIKQHPDCIECKVQLKNFDALQQHEEVQHFVCAVCSAKCTDHDQLVQHKRTDHTKCKWCKKWFRNQFELSQHEEQGPYPCGECDSEFCSPTELTLHERESHHMCSVCKVVCIGLAELELHTHHACPLCSLEFLSSAMLADHQMREHSICSVCGAAFRSKDILERHHVMQHSKNFQCAVCRQTFDTPELLATHLRSHVPCKSCATYFKDSEDLAKHIRDDHGKVTPAGDQTLLICTYCDHKFSAHEELRAHQEFKHATCKQCGLVWVDKKALATHIRKSHKKPSRAPNWTKRPGNDVRCGLCGRNFPTVEKLTLHQESHHAICPHCNTVWPNKRLLKSHIKLSHFTQQSSGYNTDDDDKVVRSGSQGESDGSDWVCKMCSKTFSSSKTLQLHIRKTHDSKLTQPHKCSFCAKVFTCKNLFDDHSRECGKGKRVPCPVCGKTFSTSGNLAQHKRIHTSEKPYRCETCGKTFAQNGTLYRHKTVHTRETPFVCSLCGKQFGLKGNLMMHLKNIHKIDHIPQVSAASPPRSPSPVPPSPPTPT